ncbi:MAG: murein L,D-transpeptidase catalytic domain family protein [Dysgonamonadaceae bacterium]|nr:murein L,D-transpeptidase catalytic domain family protein [Dysgonamonadaceae bacterium]
MRKIPNLRLSVVLTLMFLFRPFFVGDAQNRNASLESDDVLKVSDSYRLYLDLNLQNELSYEAFEQAYTGYQKLSVKNPILTLIDFSKASSKERMYVIDMEQKRVLYQTYVAHGKKSGNNYATSFSNKMGSQQSSLGFFLTGNTYKGRAGYSLVLEGLEKGINDKVRARGVVIHGADYANPETIKSSGRLGRSFGCPALPEKISKTIIDTIKEGSVLYAYSDRFNQHYLKNSSVLSFKKS